MHRHHDRDPAGLLPEASPQRHALLRLHQAGDRGAIGVRGRGQGYKQVGTLLSEITFLGTEMKEEIMQQVVVK